MTPYKAVSILKERLWGGQKLKQYNKEFAKGRIGESWETDIDTMPVLIKLIDAMEILSVQVHPDDHKALLFEAQPRGKTEAWIVLDCEEDSKIVAGLKIGTDCRQLSRALAEGNAQNLLNIINVKKGDCIYIPAGTVHSLGKGIVVYEVQQPSDLTYRLYDWNRMDEKGHSRELHIEKALSCIDFDASKVEVTNLYQQDLCRGYKNPVFQSDYFNTFYIQLTQAQNWSFKNKCFTALTLISGEAWISDGDKKEPMKKGDTWIIPDMFRAMINITAKEASEIILTEHE
ncbi:MAG: type I phosphomannose isomerase catalytic subunit [Lutisporaceae bacterium]